MSENKLPHLFEELKKASQECWASKIATYETAKKYAPLCVQIVRELGFVPRLANSRLERRMEETDGRDILDEDFWTNENMIIALFEHLEIEDLQNASA
jgi:hypothetical protein